MHSRFKEYLLQVTDSTSCEEIEIIQSLWSGYGTIARFQLTGSDLDTVVVKHIALNLAPHQTHPRGWNTDRSHQRKVRSYQVETYWYTRWNQQSTGACRTPKFIGSFVAGNNQWIILEDLDAHFPLRKHQLTLTEVKNCLSWLANFHATFMGHRPKGLWEIGTYWHLDTRPDELEKMDHPKLKAKAHEIDNRLNQCKFKSIVHGDAKLANFCFSNDGKNVAAVDFQYVGGGCGMKDVAYFLVSCLSSEECILYEEELLDFYFLELKGGLVVHHIAMNSDDIEKEWRMLYPYALNDFTRFLLGWMPAHQKVNAYHLNALNRVLNS